MSYYVAFMSYYVALTVLTVFLFMYSLLKVFIFSDKVNLTFIKVTQAVLDTKLKCLPEFLKSGPTVIGEECYPNQDAADLKEVNLDLCQTYQYYVVMLLKLTLLYVHTLYIFL